MNNNAKRKSITTSLNRINKYCKVFIVDTFVNILEVEQFTEDFLIHKFYYVACFMNIKSLLTVFKY